MTACQTLLKVVLFGGASDGAIIDLANDQEKIIIGVNTYTDSFLMDKNGHSVYFCSQGEGKLTKSFVKRLFKEEDII